MRESGAVLKREVGEASSSVPALPTLLKRLNDSSQGAENGGGEGGKSGWDKEWEWEREREREMEMGQIAVCYCAA
jgi:hypothetical protein